MSLPRIRRTGEPHVVSTSDCHLTVSVPIRIESRDLPNDGTAAPPAAGGREPTPLQLALARGHRWLAVLESGKLKSPK
jgi:hypothetical protein